MDAIMQWGIGLVLALQNIGRLAGVMKFFTFLGTEEFFLLIMPTLYWCVDAALGLRLAAVLVTSTAFNGFIKQVFHLPRPYWVDRRVQALSTATSYGLPSGHAQHATAVWGFLAAQTRRPWAWAVALALILLISLSRVYLGVHFPSDVFGGWIIGGALLLACLQWERPITAWLHGLGLWSQVGLALALSLVFLALNAAVLAVLTSTPDPAEWEQNAADAAPPGSGEAAIDPRVPEAPVTSAGLIFGLGAALAFATRHARFDARGPLAKRIARFVVGLLGVLIVWRGLALVFPTEPLLLGLALRYLRYALTIFWAIAFAPWVFLKTRLAIPKAYIS